MKKLLFAPLGITGASLGLGMVGQGVSSINSQVGTNIQETGATSAKFISPAVNITAGGLLINKLRKLKNVKRI